MTKVIQGYGVRVEAYYNLHKRCLSFRPPGGRVDHADALMLNNVTFAVQPAGRARVLMEYKKNVHAFVRGNLVWSGVGDMLDDYNEENLRRQGYRQITYNPYQYQSFVYKDTEEPIKSASQVVIVGSHIYLSGKDTTHA